MSSVILAHISDIALNTCGSPVNLFFIFALLFSLVSFFAWGKTYFTASPLFAFFFALFGSLSCIFLSHLLSRSSCRFKLLRLFGVYAGPIYLLHIPVIWFVGVPWFRIVKPKEPVLFISIVIVILADLFLSILLAKIINKNAILARIMLGATVRK